MHTHVLGMILVVAVGTGLVAESDHSSSHSGYRLYRNARFGFSVLYPVDFRPLPAPDNADGLSFVSPDGMAKLTVSGINQLGETSTDLFTRSVQLVTGRATYKHLGTDWFVISWQNDQSGQIGYRKSFFGKFSINTLVFTYPVSQRSKYEVTLLDMIRSFHPGDLNQSW